ncbi:MAG: endolytic transglycosylase MltG [Bacteroidetes bacterium]|nr:MAG: endolytic transglycosylase MltG [Bacteroidota bacterium]
MAYYHPKYTHQKKKKSKVKKFVFLFITLLIVVAVAAGYYLYQVIYLPNTWTPDGKPAALNIPTGADYSTLKTILYKNGLIVHRKNFEWVAEKKHLNELIKPGHYLIKNAIPTLELVNMLRSGNQTPVKVTFNNVRNVYQLADIVSRQIEADSASIVRVIQDSVFLKRLGLNKTTAATIFLPNTYEFWWNTNAEAFVSRMVQEYYKFWTADKINKANEAGLTKTEVSILASIVEKETTKNDEKPMIAGVYINRLKKGWRLQADPTLVFALNDYTIKRVLNKYKLIDSPYNTYKHLGLPPGPICIPSIASINAVLNYNKENYFYFCARDDFSGYHVFAKTNRQHAKNAKKYREALNKMNIKH